jgi:hypothetical protein
MRELGGSGKTRPIEDEPSERALCGTSPQRASERSVSHICGEIQNDEEVEEVEEVGNAAGEHRQRVENEKNADADEEIKNPFRGWLSSTSGSMFSSFNSKNSKPPALEPVPVFQEGWARQYLEESYRPRAVRIVTAISGMFYLYYGHSEYSADPGLPFYFASQFC